MTETVSAPPPGLVQRAQNIILKPSPTWDTIATEASDIRSIYMGYVLPLAAIAPVASAIGMSVFGVGVPGLLSYKTPFVYAIAGGIVQYVLGLVMVYVAALVIDGLAPNFGGEKNRLAAFKVAAYSMTAAWLAGIFAIIPMMGALGILGLYSLYLLYVGLPKLMKSPADKSVGYTAVVVIIMIVIGFVISLLTSPIYMMGRAGGFLAGATTGAAVGTAGGTVTIPGAGSVDLDKMQQAAAQMEAQASAMQNGQAVKTVDPNALLALMPQNYLGATPADTVASSDSVGGMAVSHAKATYAVAGGTVTLTISDMGSMAGFGAMATAMNVNKTETTANGYEKIVSQNGRMISEKYDNASRSGSYSILAGSRINIEAEGSNVDMATIKALVNGINMGQAEALAKG